MKSRFSRWSSLFVIVPQFLYNLSAGSKLVSLQDIPIPANQSDVPISLEGSRTSCRLRMREPEPFDRLIPANRPLVVGGASRAGFSSARFSAVTTYVQLNSNSVDDVLCVTDRGRQQTTYTDFVDSVASNFKVELSPGPLAVD